MSSLVRSWSVGPGVPGRLVRKVERPRPLKMSLTLEDTVALVETLIKQLEAASKVGGYDRQVRSSILNLSHNLKRLGPQVEAEDKEKLERLQVAMRAACKDEQLDLVSRVHLLELIELRAMAWNPDQNVINYYKQKLVQIEAEVAATESGSESPATAPVQLNSSALDFRRTNSTGAPSLSTSTTPVNGSTQMSRTPPTPQQRPRTPPTLQQRPRTPPARGTSSVQRTPRTSFDCLDVSPCSVDPENSFSLLVASSAGSLTVTSSNIDLVRTAKKVLDQYFSLEGPVICGEIPEDQAPPQQSLQEEPRYKELEAEPRYKVHGGHTSPSPDITYGRQEGEAKPDITYGRQEGEAKPDITYGRQELLHLSKSPLCKLPPPHWDKVLQGVPSVVKARPSKISGGPARQLIERAVDELARQEAAKAV